MADVNETMIQGTKVVSGETVTFDTPREVDIKSLKVYFSPKQDGSGTPSPDNVRPIEGWESVEIEHSGNNSNSYSADWLSEFGIIYGGYVDLISGELVQEWQKIKISDLVWNNWGKLGLMYSNNNIQREAGTELYADSIECDGTANPQTKDIGVLGYYKTDVRYPNYLFIQTGIEGADGYNYLIQRREWIQSTYPDTYICYKLATPITYSLTPQQITAFKNSNTFQSNAERIEVEYDFINTFDAIESRKNIMKNTPHLETVKNDVANFSTDMFALIKDAKFYFAPKQDLHGYSSPFPSGGGKNLLNPATNPIWTGGVYTINSDGSVTVSGSDGRGWTTSQITPLELAAGTYTISWTGSPRIQFTTSDSGYENVQIISSNVGFLTFTLENDGAIKWKHSGNTTDYPLTVRVQIEKGSTATAYEPYAESNVCPIEGWNEVGITKCGKNLFDISTVIKNKYVRAAITSSGSNVGEEVDSSNFNCTPFIKVKPNTVYTTTVPYVNVADAAGLCFYSEQATSSFISGVSIVHQFTNGERLTTYTFTTPANCKYLRFCWFNREGNNCQLEEGTSSAVESYVGQNIPISFTNTVYGGYLDLTTGELWKTYHYYEFTGDETFYQSGSWVTMYLPKINGVNPTAKTPTSGVCSHYPYAPYKRGYIGVMGNEHDCTFDSSIHDANGWKSFAKEQYEAGTPLTICYELRDPILVGTLTPQQLDSFRGVNNIWSNTNDQTEITYWKHKDETQQYIPAEIVLASNDNFIIVTDDGYVIGDENDYIEY